MTTLEKKGQDLIAHVRFESYREFVRHNVRNNRAELQCCISMSPTDGGDAWYVTFTSVGTQFAHVARSMQDGECRREFTLRCKFKRRQAYGGKPQIAVTHCQAE